MKKSKLRIVFITPAFPTFVCGVGDHIAKLCEELIKINIEVSVITSKQIKIDPYYKKLGIDCYPEIEKWDLIGWKKAFEISRRLDVDLVHFQYPARYPAGRSFVLRLLPFTLPFIWYSLASGFSPKRVITIHEYYKSPILAMIKLLFDIGLSAKTILVNQADFSSIRRIFNFKRKIIYSHIGPTIKIVKYPQSEITRTRKKLHIDSESFILSYFGFIDPSKGFGDIVDALKILKPRKFKIKLIVIGETKASDYLNGIKATIKSSGLEKDIIWTGYIPENEISLYLQVSDLAVLPYLNGATANRSTSIAPLLLEVPILSTYVKGITPEEFKNKLILVAPNAPEELVLAIENFKNNPKVKNKLIDASASLSKKYNWKSIAHKTKEIYESLY